MCNYTNRAFVSTRPLVHKHVKISVDEWILDTTRPHNNVQIPEYDFFFASLCLAESSPTYYCPQMKFAKVMFLQVSVCPEGGMHGCQGVCVIAGGGACMVARG